jgi:hypothetical protein
MMRRFEDSRHVRKVSVTPAIHHRQTPTYIYRREKKDVSTGSKDTSSNTKLENTREVDNASVRKYVRMHVNLSRKLVYLS